MKPVLASEANITKVSEGDLTVSISDDEDLTVSVAAKLIHEMRDDGAQAGLVGAHSLALVLYEAQTRQCALSQ
eukprot:6906409-Prymnesium_polylepis.1